MIDKELLERLSFLHVIMKEYPEALEVQKRICAINQKLYFDQFQTDKPFPMLPHPLLGTQLYQLAKIQMNLNLIDEGRVNLEKTLKYLEPVLSLKSSKDGKMLDEKFLLEMKENLFSMQHQAQVN